MSDEKQSEFTNAQSIPDSPRLVRVMEFAYDAGISVENNHYAHTVYGNGMTCSYVTIEELERAVEQEAADRITEGEEAALALAKWREGR